MSLEKLFNKYISRLDDLIYRGQKIAKTLRDKMRHESLGKLYGYEEGIELQVEDYAEPYRIPEYELKLQEWQINTKTLLNQILPEDALHREVFNEISMLKTTKLESKDCAIVESAISKMQAIRDDLNAGFLGNLELQIEAEIVADYMGQAEKLLSEAATGQYDHVPAAVLAGAVLEKELRTLCLKQNPPLSIVKIKKNKEEYLTLNPLIQNLKDAGVFNEQKAKQLRAWTDIRNKAAHGKFDEFNKNDVENMIRGINDFLADYLRQMGN